jgi:tRNA-dihydrouridine synthase A
MMGRAAYQSPWVLADADASLFGAASPVQSRAQALEAFKPYVAHELSKGTPLSGMTRHVLGLFNGLPWARAFRRHLSENSVKRGVGVEVIDEAVEFVREDSTRVAA